MANLLNQFSYLYFSATILVLTIGIAAVLSYRRQGRFVWKVISTLAASVAVLMMMLFMVLRPGAATIDSVQEVQQVIANDRPTVVQFYSNYCIGCMSVEAQFNSLAATLSSTADILRVDIHTDFGRQLREELDFSYTPEFIIYDASGTEVWRGHNVPSEDMLLASDTNVSDS